MQGGGDRDGMGGHREEGIGMAWEGTGGGDELEGREAGVGLEEVEEVVQGIEPDAAIAQATMSHTMAVRYQRSVSVRLNASPMPICARELGSLKSLSSSLHEHEGQSEQLECRERSVLRQHLADGHGAFFGEVVLAQPRRQHGLCIQHARRKGRTGCAFSTQGGKG